MTDSAELHDVLDRLAKALDRVADAEERAEARNRAAQATIADARARIVDADAQTAHATTAMSAAEAHMAAANVRMEAADVRIEEAARLSVETGHAGDTAREQLASAHEETSRAAEDQERYQRALYHYTQIVRHRLANPLQIILGMAQTLLQENDLDEASRREMLASIEYQAHVLVRARLFYPEVQGEEEHGLEPGIQSNDATRATNEAGDPGARNSPSLRQDLYESDLTDLEQAQREPREDE